jgi:recombination protein RecR
MQLTVEPVARLIEQFARLPGIGPKTAQRLTFYLLRAPEQVSNELAEAIGQMKQSVKFCSICQNITDADPCAVCCAENRDRSVICVVEEPLDILALERTRGYKGLYHVLHGALSPVEGVGPDDLKIGELLARLQRDQVQEVILATRGTGDPNCSRIACRRRSRIRRRSDPRPSARRSARDAMSFAALSNHHVYCTE